MTYFLFNSDLGEPTKATFIGNTFTIYYHNNITVSIEDTGEGYLVIDTSPGSKVKKVLIDYSLMSDLATAMKIFAKENGQTEGDYWSIYKGEKI